MTTRASRSAHRLRAIGNLLNLSTPLGLMVAALGRSRLRRGPQALLLAEGYRLAVPRAGAFTIGNVVLVPGRTMVELERHHPGTLDHEDVHAWQYLACLGLPFLPLYAIAAGWSWLRTGHPASANLFERRAGLSSGGYPQRPADNAGLRQLARAVGRRGRRGTGPSRAD